MYPLAGWVSGSDHRQCPPLSFSAPLLLTHFCSPIFSATNIDLLWPPSLAALDEQLASYRAGRTNLSKFFMGQAFKATRGRVDGKVVEACVLKLLRESEESHAP